MIRFTPEEFGNWLNYNLLLVSGFLSGLRNRLDITMKNTINNCQVPTDIQFDLARDSEEVFFFYF